MQAPLTPRGAFGQSAMARTSEVVGTVLGSRDLDAGMRWEHLADDEAACQAIKTSVLIHHILPQ
eukprot:6292145-Prymnesium_polylepis.1